MYSEVEDGKVLDFHYKKISEYEYAFYIGDIYLGLICKMSRNRWSAFYSLSYDSLVHGFASRHDASEYILQLRRKSRKYQG